MEWFDGNEQHQKDPRQILRRNVPEFRLIMFVVAIVDVQFVAITVTVVVLIFDY